MARQLYDEHGNPVKRRGGCLKWAGIIFLVFIVLSVIVGISGGDAEDTTTTSEPATEEVATGEDSNTESESEQEEADEDVPREHRNALRSAENYLSFAGFSEQGLRDQLAFEEFPQESIDYAMENIEVDWNEQALKSAQSYDDWAAMSDEGLKNQLMFEGFTEEQAQYAIDNL